MKMCHIVPLNCIDLQDKYNDMHLLLYHWARAEPQYLNYFKQSKKYKILDNSFYELRSQIAEDDFIKCAQEIKADEIVCPDEMYNFKKTKKLIEDFIPLVPKGMKIQCVCCGKDMNELYDCYQWMNNNEMIDVISLSKKGFKETNLDYYSSRRILLSEMQYRLKEIHLLGVNNVRDFFINSIRSIDGKWLAKIVNKGPIDLNTKIDRVKMENAFIFFKRLCDDYQSV
jgi:DNA-directed RNA polymerase subunit N (RpoN/RPB10)